MVTWPVLYCSGKLPGHAARLLLRPSATARTTPRDRSPEASTSYLGRTPPKNGVRPFKLRLGLGSTHAHARTPICCTVPTVPPRHWPAGRPGHAWRLGGWRRCIHPPVAPSLSFWCPLSRCVVRLTNPANPTGRRPMATGQTSCSRQQLASDSLTTARALVHQVISSSHAWPAVAKGPAPGHHLSRKAMAVACAAPGV
jgi:hypothetical protein